MIQTDSPLTVQLVRELAPELKEHAGVLADYARALAPHREQLLDAWMALDENHTLTRDWYELAYVMLVEALESTAGSFDSFLNGVIALTSQAQGVGLEFPQAVHTFTRLRRAALPFILEKYQAGPELELLFQSLNTLERAVRSLVGAVYVQAGQLQLADTARLRVIGNLTHGVAHSLNNLLTNILGRAQWMEQKATDEALRVEARSIQAAALIAADSLHRIQEYAAPKAERESVPMDLTEAVNDAVQLTRYRWRDDAEAHGIVIDVIRDMADVPPVLGRRGQLRDAVVELILNAVEAMPTGGSITLRTERVGDRIQLAVTDMGEGMDEVTLSHALTPFFSTKGSGHVGLGLANAEQIVAEHDSHLEIASTPGQGTTVTFALPIAEGELVEEVAPAEAPTQAVNILIVDDDAAIREIAAKALSLGGHHTLTAETGPEAMMLFREQGPFEVVLCDLGMPGMNGLQVAKEIKAVAPHTVFLLMTGWGAELDERAVAQEGVDQIIRKPFDVEQVLQSIGQAMAAREKK